MAAWSRAPGAPTPAPGGAATPGGAPPRDSGEAPPLFVEGAHAAPLVLQVRVPALPHRAGRRAGARADPARTGGERSRGRAG